METERPFMKDKRLFRCIDAGELTGNGFFLRPLHEKDITDRYICWLNDSQVNRYLEVRLTPQTRDTVQEYVHSFYRDEPKYLWGIYPKESKDYIGTVTLNSITVHASAELGLMIGELKYWGTGASIEALNLVIRFAFDILKLRRLSGGTYSQNMGMNFTFKRLGFRCEGKLIQSYELAPEIYSDEYRWGLLASEWKKARGSAGI